MAKASWVWKKCEACGARLKVAKPVRLSDHFRGCEAFKAARTPKRALQLVQRTLDSFLPDRLPRSRFRP